MKKILLLSVLLAAGISFLKAQTFDYEDFEGYGEGAFFPVVNPGFSIGPNQWRMYAYDDELNGDQTSDNLGIENAQIVNFQGSKAIKLQGPNNTTGFRTMFKSGFKEAWQTRDVGNNVLKVDFDIAIAETQSSSRVQLHATAAADQNYKILMGVAFNTADNTVKGLIRQLNPDDNEEFLNAIALDGANYEADVVYHFTCAYNVDTKEVIWLCDDLGIHKTEVGFTDVEPAEVDVFMSHLEEAANPTEAYIDNLKQSFTDADFLSVDSDTHDNKCVIFPNPATNIIHLNLAKILDGRNVNIQICDMQGRLLLEPTFANSIDISTLPKGMYIIKLRAENYQYTQALLKL